MVARNQTSLNSSLSRHPEPGVLPSMLHSASSFLMQCLSNLIRELDSSIDYSRSEVASCQFVAERVVANFSTQLSAIEAMQGRMGDRNIHLAGMMEIESRLQDVVQAFQVLGAAPDEEISERLTAINQSLDAIHEATRSLTRELEHGWDHGIHSVVASSVSGRRKNALDRRSGIDRRSLMEGYSEQDRRACDRRLSTDRRRAA